MDPVRKKPAKLEKAEVATASGEASIVAGKAGDNTSGGFIIGYSMQNHMAFKKPVSSRVKSKGQSSAIAPEYTKVYAKPGAQDSDYVFATFGDGVERAITDFTVAEHRTREEINFKSNKGALFSEKFDDTSVVKLKKQKCGHDEGVAVYKDSGNQKHQLTQIMFKWFKGDAHTQREACVKVGLSLCNDIMEKKLEPKNRDVAVARDKYLEAVRASKKRDNDAKENPDGERKRPRAKDASVKAPPAMTEASSVKVEKGITKFPKGITKFPPGVLKSEVIKKEPVDTDPTLAAAAPAGKELEPNAKKKTKAKAKAQTPSAPNAAASSDPGATAEQNDDLDALFGMPPSYEDCWL